LALNCYSYNMLLNRDLPFSVNRIVRVQIGRMPTRIDYWTLILMFTALAVVLWLLKGPKGPNAAN